MKRLLSGCFALVLLGSLQSTAQPGADPLTELRQQLSQARSDTARGRTWLDMAFATERPDSSLYFAQQSLASLQKGVPTAPGPERQRVRALVADATNVIAEAYKRQGNNQQAMLFFAAAARRGQEAGNVLTQVASLNGLGALQANYLGNYPLALRTCQQALRAGEHVPAAQEAVSGILNGLASIYANMGDLPAAIRYNERALMLDRQSGDTMAIAHELLSIASIYQERLHDLGQTEEYVQQTLQLANAYSHGRSPVMALALEQLGNLRRQQHRWAEARQALQQGLALMSQHGNRPMQARYLVLLARTENEAGQWRAGVAYGQQAVALLAGGSLPQRRAAEQALYQLYDKLHQPQPALEHYRRFIALRDSIESRAQMQGTYQQRLREETARKDETAAAKQRQRDALAAAEARRQRLLRYALLSVAALLLALAGVLWNRSRLRQRANALLSEQKNELAVAAGKLQALNATKDRLFAIVAHDLRNPLAALTGIQALIQRYVRRGEPERLVELGDHLHQTAQGLYGVLDNVLGWAISQRGELEARPEPVDVAALVQEAATIGQLQATAQDIALRVEIAPDLHLRTDRQMLRTVLRNLLGNALKFTPAGGSVTLAAGGDAETVVFRIADSGPGFSAAAARAWEAAEVGPRTADASGRSGQGLGLVVCRAFARQLGGELSWGNRPEGGTEMTLRLPINITVDAVV